MIKNFLIRTFTHGADWCIKVNGHSKIGDNITRTFYISEKLYNTINIGNVIDTSNLSEYDMNNQEIELIGEEI